MINWMIYASGHVQGVGYRLYAKQHADQLGLSGYAKNLSDGRVEIFVKCEKTLLEIFCERLRQYPKGEGSMLDISESDQQVLNQDFYIA